MSALLFCCHQIYIWMTLLCSGLFVVMLLLHVDMDPCPFHLPRTQNPPTYCMQGNTLMASFAVVIFFHDSLHRQDNEMAPQIQEKGVFRPFQGVWQIQWPCVLSIMRLCQPQSTWKVPPTQNHNNDITGEKEWSFYGPSCHNSDLQTHFVNIFNLPWNKTEIDPFLIWRGNRLYSISFHPHLKKMRYFSIKRAHN